MFLQKKIYKIINEAAHSGRQYIELPLGQGNVDFDNYLRALNVVGYRGFLTIEREIGENPMADIAMAVEFLKNKINTL